MPLLGLCFCVGAWEVIEQFSATENDGPHRVERQVPVRGSQNLIKLSLEPETRRPFVGCHSTHRTSQPWPARKVNTKFEITTNYDLPVSTRSSRLSSNAHSFSVESSLAVTNLESFGLKLRPRTASECACQALTLFILG